MTLFGISVFADAKKGKDRDKTILDLGWAQIQSQCFKRDSSREDHRGRYLEMQPQAKEGPGLPVTNRNEKAWNRFPIGPPEETNPMALGGWTTVPRAVKQYSVLF